MSAQVRAILKRSKHNEEDNNSDDDDLPELTPREPVTTLAPGNTDTDASSSKGRTVAATGSENETQETIKGIHFIDSSEANVNVSVEKPKHRRDAHQSLRRPRDGRREARRGRIAYDDNSNLARGNHGPRQNMMTPSSRYQDHHRYGGHSHPARHNQDHRHPPKLSEEGWKDTALPHEDANETLNAGDKFIGEEKTNVDLSLEDIDEYDAKLTAQAGSNASWDWIVFFLFLNVAMLVAFLSSYSEIEDEHSSHDYRRVINLILWCGGIALAVMLLHGAVSSYMHSSEKSAKEKEKRSRRREAMRKMERDVILRHDEIVFYNSADAFGMWTKLCCCPFYSKITSKRLVHSTNGHVKTYSALSENQKGDRGLLQTFVHIICWPCCCFADCISGCRRLYHRQVDTVAFDKILDVSVKQDCQSFFNNEGTLIIHVEGPADESTMISVCKQLPELIKQGKLQKMKATYTAFFRNIPQTSMFYQSRLDLEKAIAEHKESGQASSSLVIDRNTSPESAHHFTVEVPGVKDPYTVMDDVGYLSTVNRAKQRRSEDNRSKKDGDQRKK